MTTSETYEVVVEPERLPQRKLVAILVGGIAVVIASALVVKAWLPPRPTIETGGYSGPTERVGFIEQTLILAVHSEQDRQKRERDLLEHFAWVDKQRGIVAIPINRAMDIVVHGHRP
jgi:hypothetical protein